MSDDSSSLLGAAPHLRDLAAKSAAEADQDRRLDPQLPREIRAAGFARHFVPTAAGGAGGNFTELLEAVAVVAQGCTATAWVASLAAMVARLAAFLPDDGQAELWAGGPDQLVVGGLMPVGRAVPDGEGWRLSGSWPYISGLEFSDWALLCALADTGDRQPQARYFAVPRQAYRSQDTWFTVGMRGTGSNTLILDDVAVPADRSFARQEAIDPPVLAGAPPCRQVPLRAVNGLSFVAPALGAARAMLQLWSQHLSAKPALPGRPAGTQTISTTVAAALARSSGEIDMAGLLLDRAARTADVPGMDAAGTARNARDCALSAELLAGAVNRLFQAAGTSGQSQATAMERIWRDVNVAVTHLALQFEPAAAGFAAQLLTCERPAPAAPGARSGLTEGAR